MEARRAEEFTDVGELVETSVEVGETRFILEILGEVCRPSTQLSFRRAEHLPAPFHSLGSPRALRTVGPARFAARELEEDRRCLRRSSNPSESQMRALRRTRGRPWHCQPKGVMNRQSSG